jgi:hypothetical protein
MDWRLLFHFELRQCRCAANCSTVLSPLAGSSVCAGPTNVTASFRYSAPNAQSTAYSAAIAGSSVVCTASGECLHTYPAQLYIYVPGRDQAYYNAVHQSICPVLYVRMYAQSTYKCRLASTG